MENNNLYHVLLKYEEYINLGNTLLKKIYNIDIPPLLAKNRGIIPSTGEIVENTMKFTFKFHGMGCLFSFQGIAVDFNYSYGDFLYRGFEPSKLYQFIMSFTSLSDPLRDVNQFNDDLEALVSMGKLKEKDNESIDIYKYERVGSVS